MKKYLFLTVIIVLLSGFNSKAQTALEFDGTDDYVQTDYAGVLGTTPRTFQAWIYLSTAPTSNISISDYGLNAVGSRNTFIVNGSGYLAYLSGGTNANISASVATVPIGSWVHVAFVYDGTDGYLYQNGEQVGTGLLTTVNTPTGGTNFRIGQRVSGGNIPFEGKIDEVRVWDMALTPQEIIDYACIGDPSQFDNLLTYYDFNDGSGTILTDLVGGYDGTLTNMDEEDWVVSEVCENGYNITFVVTEEGTTPVENAMIDLDGEVKYTDVNGEAVYYYYEPGNYDYIISKSDYYEQTGSVEVIDDEITQNVTMPPIVEYNITFIVTEDPGGAPVEDANVNLDGLIQMTNENGETTFTNYLPGTYNYVVLKDGYELVTGDALLIDEDLLVDVSLPLIISYFDITFVVTEEPGGVPLDSAMVDLDGVTQYTNDNGETTFTSYLPDTYSYVVSKDGYELVTGDAVLIDENLLIEVNLPLIVSYFDITFVLTEEPGGVPIDNAIVDLDGVTQYTNENGETTFIDYLPGSYPYTISKEGYYFITGTAEVIDDDLLVEIELLIDYIQQNEIIDVSIFPNPTNGILNIKLKDEHPFNITICDISGHIIDSFIMKDKMEQIDLSGVQKGMYFIKLQRSNEIVTLPLLIR